VSVNHVLEQAAVEHRRLFAEASVPQMFDDRLIGPGGACEDRVNQNVWEVGERPPAILPPVTDVLRYGIPELLAVRELGAKRRVSVLV
jgi:hypothetical protein